MILVELEIENYKQFAGLHRFAPQPSGVVGIIGANGAGKTTSSRQSNGVSISQETFAAMRSRPVATTRIGLGFAWFWPTR